MSLPWSNRKEKDMFKTIVLALDGSDGAKQAIPVAAELAEKEKANIVIAHVTEYLAAKGGELPRVDEDQISRRRPRNSRIVASRPRSNWPTSRPVVRHMRSSILPTAMTAMGFHPPVATGLSLPCAVFSTSQFRGGPTDTSRLADTEPNCLNSP